MLASGEKKCMEKWCGESQGVGSSRHAHGLQELHDCTMVKQFFFRRFFVWLMTVVLGPLHLGSVRRLDRLKLYMGLGYSCLADTEMI